MGHVLAIDPGITTGWACSDGTCGSLSLVAQFNRDRGEALAAFADWLSAQITGCKTLVIERPMGGMAATEIPMVLTARAHEVGFTWNVDRREYTVSAIRKVVCGSGRADKKAVRPAVEALGYKPRNLHEADACAVLACFIAAQADAVTA